MRTSLPPRSTSLRGTRHPGGLVFRWARGVALAALCLYCGLAFYQLRLPGFYYDEALDLPAAIHLARGQTPALSPNDPGLTLGGTTYPLMILDYLGAANTYLLWPVFVFIGASWLSVRWFEVLLGAIILALSHRLARAWFGSSVAALTALLIAVNPSFIFWTRMGISVTHLMSVCSVGSLLALQHWTRTQRNRWLFLGGFFLGLGLWAKFLFLWWVLALALVCALTIFSRPAREWWPRGVAPLLKWKLWGAGALGFSVGASPLIYYNLRTGLTYRILLNSLNAPTEYGVNNSHVLGNLRAAWEQFHIFLDGSYFWYNGAIHANPWAYPAWLFTLAVLLALLIRLSPRVRSRAMAVVLIIAAIVFQSAFTVSGIWATHLYLLVPFIQIVVALAAVSAWNVVAGFPRLGMPMQWSLRLASALLVLIFFIGDLNTTGRYYVSLTQFGGVGRFSDAIYPLADYLDRHNFISPAALDWGLQKNLLILTNGRVIPIEIFGYSPAPDAGFRERVLASLCDECVFVNVDQAYAVYPREAAFRQILAEAGYAIAEEIVFRERSGQAAYEVYRVKPVK